MTNRTAMISMRSLSVALALSTHTAVAQEDVFVALYRESCSVCHGENLVTRESGLEGNRDHVVVARRELRRRALEPQARRVLLRRFTQDTREQPVQMKARLARALGNGPQRHVAGKVPADLAEQAKQSALGLHCASMA